MHDEALARAHILPKTRISLRRVSRFGKFRGLRKLNTLDDQGGDLRIRPYGYRYGIVAITGDLTTVQTRFLISAIGFAQKKGSLAYRHCVYDDRSFWNSAKCRFLQ